MLSFYAGGKTIKARNRIKPLLTLCCALLLVAAGVFGTLAYLTGTDTVNNTFTVGNVKITLDEARVTTDGAPVEGADRVKANEYHLLPGHTYTKDPTVTVKANSEACWLFVKVTESENLDTFITYAIADDWTVLPGVDGVYYREVPASATDRTFSVLAGNAVTVKSNVTKTMLETAKTNAPTLTIKAYAIQKDHFATADTAWAEVSK